MLSNNTFRRKLPKFHCNDLDKTHEKYGHLAVGEVFERLGEENYSTFADNLQVFKLNT